MEKVQKGGKGQHKNQKVHNSKFGLFDKRGEGGYISIFFQKVNVDFKCFR